jgi:hypothetical protein
VDKAEARTGPALTFTGARKELHLKSDLVIMLALYYKSGSQVFVVHTADPPSETALTGAIEGDFGGAKLSNGAQAVYDYRASRRVMLFERSKTLRDLAISVDSFQVRFRSVFRSVECLTCRVGHRDTALRVVYCYSCGRFYLLQIVRIHGMKYADRTMESGGHIHEYVELRPPYEG